MAVVALIRLPLILAENSPSARINTRFFEKQAKTQKNTFQPFFLQGKRRKMTILRRFCLSCDNEL